MNEQNFESYSDFAALYDILMDDIPYKKWQDFAHQKLNSHGINSGLLLDLACGSGTLTEAFSHLGYDLIGVDSSPSMLDAAIKKRDLSGSDILYLCQDMRSFELYGTVRAAICFCDSINYLTDPTDLNEVFRLVNNYLDPGGLFIFDANTVHKYRDMIGDSTIAENRDEGSFIWENYYDEQSGVNEYDITFFIREEDGRFRKSCETHYQRGYSPDDVRAACDASGLLFIECVDEETMLPPTDDSERIIYVLQECGKRN